MRPAQRYDDFKLIRITCQAACHGKTEHGIFVKFKKPAKLLSSYLKNQQNCCRPTCRCHHLGYSVPPALHRTIWCRSTFGPRGPGLSNPTSFLRPDLPMAPTRDDNARDKRSVLRPKFVKFKTPAKLLSSYLPVSNLGYSVPPALHRTIWCRSTFGLRGPGLSNPTSFLRPALPMAPTRDDNARDKRSVLRPNPATFLRDFALYMTTNYASISKRCLNYTARIILSTPMTPFGVIGF